MNWTGKRYVLTTDSAGWEFIQSDPFRTTKAIPKAAAVVAGHVPPLVVGVLT